MDRRREFRNNSDDIIRWKRPGRIEDHRAWSIDNSPSGIGFMTHSRHQLIPGDALHLRREEDRLWATVDRNVRVIRITPTSSPDVVIVGCELGDPINVHCVDMKSFE